MIKYTPYKWTCPRCGLSHRIKNCYTDNNYFKRCSCGRVVELDIEMYEDITYKPKIVGAREVHLRCQRGKPKK